MVWRQPATWLWVVLGLVVVVLALTAALHSPAQPHSSVQPDVRLVG